MRGTERSTNAISIRSAAAAPRLSFLWPVVAAGVVLYASVLPFHVDLSAYRVSNGFGLANIAFCATTPSDIVVNIGVYAVLTFVASWYLIQRAPRRCTRAVMTIMPAVGLSLLVEALQTGIAGRVGSWWDVVLNATGAMLGATVAMILCRRFDAWLGRFRQASYERPFRIASVILGVSLFLYHLMPFDFVAGTDALHAAFRRAQLGFTHVHPADATASPVAPLAKDLATAAWFALLALLAALDRRRRGNRPIHAMLVGARHAVVLAAVIEVLQLFTMSHVFATADFIQRAAAATFGAWCGVFLFDHYRLMRRVREAPQGISLGLLAIVLLIQLLVIGGDVHLLHLARQGQDATAVVVLPFEALWRAPLHTAVASVVPIFVTYGLLAATAALMLSRSHRTAALPVACFAASMVALIAALVEATPATTALDITNPLLATFAAFAAVEVLHALQNVRSQPQAV